MAEDDQDSGGPSVPAEETSDSSSGPPTALWLFPVLVVACLFGLFIPWDELPTPSGGPDHAPSPEKREQPALSELERTVWALQDQLNGTLGGGLSGRIKGIEAELGDMRRKLGDMEREAIDARYEVSSLRDALKALESELNNHKGPWGGHR
jgi:hypothetical protein